VALGANDTVTYYNRAVAFSMIGDGTRAQKDFETSCLRGYTAACPFSRISSQPATPTL